jgi:parvulin-like peptidyl-prolyl isomerase
MGEVRGPTVLGWVNGAPVFASALDAYLAELAHSAEGARLGLDEDPPADGSDAPVAGGGEIPVLTQKDRASAIRSWSTRALLIDLLLAQEAARFGVVDVKSPDEWTDRLIAGGEVCVADPTGAELFHCYQANIHRYQVAEARRVRHVLLADPAEATRLAGELREPWALVELARANSLDAGTRSRGGDLGWVERGQLSGALEEAIFEAGTGQICGPVESGFGWHLLVVEAVRASRTRPFVECRDQIANELINDRRRMAWREWWDRRVAEAITVPAGAEDVLFPGLPGTSHRH